MNKALAIIKSLYFHPRFFKALGVLAFIFILSFFFYPLFAVAKLLFIILFALTIVDGFIMYGNNEGIVARRIAPEKLSNGDENKIMVSISNQLPFAVEVMVIDELPVQFQIRDFFYKRKIEPQNDSIIEYTLRPVKRGEYHFGKINVYVSGKISLIRRRYSFADDQMVPVYPSFIQMRKYELLAIHSRITEGGLKKMRRIGASTEFEQIREYVQGDEFRRINWKATARKNSFMVNNYQEEKAQQVYSIIDKGRAMKMPFDGLSLLDYSINASLVISNIAILKQDKAGLITFSDRLGAFLPADRKSLQMQKILSVLYNQKSNFSESNYEVLSAYLKKKVTHRSLFLFFTNFESLSSLRRQLPYFAHLAKNHVLVIIFFENTELKTLLGNTSKSTLDVYVKTIAEKLAYEKRLIVKELEQNGIYSILTSPQNLTVNTINKYLELKSRGII